MVMTNHPNLILKLHQSDVDLAKEAKDLKATIKSMTDRLETINTYFRDSMLAQGAQVATWRSATVVMLEPYERTTIDSKLLRLKYPDIATECEKASHGWTPKYI